MKLSKHYAQEDLSRSGIPEPQNWRNNDINDSLYYSFRSTRYDRSGFPARLHYHEYYELLFYAEGDVRYICEQDSWRPQRGDVILIPPHQLHMSMPDSDTTLYTRHVFYFYPDAFDRWGCRALTGFLSRSGGNHFVIHTDPTEKDRLFGMLETLDRALAAADDPLEQAHAAELILRIFYRLNRGVWQDAAPDSLLPPKLHAVQCWIDQNYASVENVAEVAKHFFYSREYLTRQFKRWFNTTPADYIAKRRVVCAQKLLCAGAGIQEACAQAGFSSMTTFIRAFRHVTGTTPARYRANVRGGT